MPGNNNNLEKELKVVRNPEKKADILNALAWGCRYSDTDKALDYGTRALDTANKISYSKGIAYAKLYISVCNFLLSKEDNILI